MSHTFESRSRLISLAYGVLNRLDIPASGMTDVELLSALTAECRKTLAAMAESEQKIMKERGKPALPEIVFAQNPDDEPRESRQKNNALRQPKPNGAREKS